LMFADDIRVFDVCMVCVCMMFIKTKSAKKHGHPVADTGWTKYKIYYDKWMVYCFIWLSQQTGPLQEAIVLSKPTTIVNIRANENAMM